MVEAATPKGHQRSREELDVLVVGAGFAGLYALHLYRKLGFRVRVVEAGGGVGGVWYWNRYPGARCDVESLQYCYSFDAELYRSWSWKERFAPQGEILAYLNHVADRLDLRRDIRLNTRVEKLAFSEVEDIWSATLDNGETISTRFCVLATGPLSATQLPDIPGMETFQGLAVHTALWPAEPVELEGKRVGVIGTGSTGIQVIQEAAKVAGRLTVFQRTPNFCIPLGNRPLDASERDYWKENVVELKRRARTETARGVVAEIGNRSALSVDAQTRNEEFEKYWRRGGSEFMQSFNDITRHPESNRHAAEFVRAKIAETVRDPRVAAMLTPDDHPIGSKRICLGIDYYDAYNRDNVDLVNIRENPIVSIDAKGINLRDGHVDLDVIVFATGFDAVTGAASRIDIEGRGGKQLKEDWAENPIAHLGLTMPDFPNLFLINGPGSPSVLTNVVMASEQHVELVADILQHMRANALSTVEPTSQARKAWSDTVQKAAAETVYVQANSWYVGANVPGKARIFLPYIGGLHTYRGLCNDIVRDGFREFSFTGGAESAAAASG